jgi:hypothetical protein
MVAEELSKSPVSLPLEKRVMDWVDDFVSSELTDSTCGFDNLRGLIERYLGDADGCRERLDAHIKSLTNHPCGVNVLALVKAARGVTLRFIKEMSTRNKGRGFATSSSMAVIGSGPPSWAASHRLLRATCPTDAGTLRRSYAILPRRWSHRRRRCGSPGSRYWWTWPSPTPWSASSARGPMRRLACVASSATRLGAAARSPAGH